MTDREWLEYIVEWLENAECDINDIIAPTDVIIDIRDLMTPFGENGWSLHGRLEKYLQDHSTIEKS